MSVVLTVILLALLFAFVLLVVYICKSCLFGLLIAVCLNAISWALCLLASVLVLVHRRL